MKLIDGHDVIEHAEVNGEDREFIRLLMDYIEDADEVETLYCCDREKCENCNSDCFLTRDKSHAGKPTSVIIIDGIAMVPSVVEPSAEWMEDENGLYCSECKERAFREYSEAMNNQSWYEDVPTKFCPNCGARMKGTDNE